ncbi:MAG: DUF1285 domain-containing protein [Gammaproteobacteria bacterium]|nr:MAG: DUF1285 domain-containing protein [Gammaproteobacteria bacterium]
MNQVDALKRLYDQLEGRRAYPVEQWDPPFCGDMDIRIDGDGRWWYRENPIDRPELVRLFAAILKREGHDYMLVTPVEKVRIQVKDVPFVFTRYRILEDQGLTWLALETETGDNVVVSAEHPIELRQRAGESVELPYVEVRNNLWGVPGRALYYRLIEECLVERALPGQGLVWGVQSGGEFYPLSRQVSSG